jgi:hemolysin activation/secretion protein
MNEPLSNLDGGNMFNAVQKQKIIFGNTQSYKTKRLPRKTDAITFFALLKGQNSAQQLDITDKIKPNDIYASKYYPERKLYDDQGYILNLEARVKLLDFSTRKSNLMQLVFFVDTSAIAMNQYIFTDGLNHTTLSGAGVGINWSYEDNYDVKIYFSNKLDKQVLGITPDFSQLFWFQAVKYY